MPLYDIFQEFDGHDRPEFELLYPSRSELCEQVRKRPVFDIAVVGGGIHGACAARLAALNGLRTILLERADYGSETSSRSSKMLHGGIRYLEMFDLLQVFEGVRARSRLLRTAEHLTSEQEFLIPVEEGNWWFKTRMGVGLRLYDLLALGRNRRHRWYSRNDLSSDDLSLFSGQLKGCFGYFDGIMRDTRMVIENIVSARQEGAICLNHAPVISVGQAGDSVVDLSFRDRLTDKKFNIRAGVVLNCAGPWAPQLGSLSPTPLSKEVSFSRGTHLLFSVPWKHPALLLPLPERYRYYFVWPHFAGTLVGTTETEVPNPTTDPLPTKPEIEELLGHLARDLPGAGLNRENLHYAFTGLRTLPLRGSGRSSAERSRRHRWVYARGMLNLLGGKFTSAEFTALDGLRRAFRLARFRQKLSALGNRNLPGTTKYKESIKEFSERAAAAGVPAEVIKETIGRLGSRVRWFDYFRDEFELIGGRVLRAEVDLACYIEQAQTVGDLMRRRFELELQPDHGLDLLDPLVSYLKSKGGSEDLDSQAEDYRERIARVKELLRS